MLLNCKVFGNDMPLFANFRFFFYFDKILSYAVVPRLSGENSRCFLFIFVPVSGVFVFIVL